MPDKKSSPLWTLLVLLLVFGAVVMVGQWRSRASVPLPAPLPPVNVQGWLNVDAPPTTEELAGRWVVVDLWATWCGPCIAAMPALVEFHRRWQDENVVVIGIADDGAEALGELNRVIATVPGFRWPVAYGGSEAIGSYPIRGIPSVALYDPTGERVYLGSGAAALGELEMILEEAVGSGQ